jgi:membrane-associated protein
MLDLLHQGLDLIRHLDDNIASLTSYFGAYSYIPLFAIIFCETGLVVTPFLPGDSLLFALGAFATNGSLNLPLMMILLTVAAIVGDSVNYWLGALLGPRIFRGERIWLLNKKHLERTHEFFERYGGKTIILARFVPIVRTFAPFVAGMGRMTYRRFMAYNVIGGVIWINIFLVAGYLFGQWKPVKDNFEFVVFAIIIVSVLPAVFEFCRVRRQVTQGAT